VKQTIYVDVLISVNLLVDYFLLFAAAVISGRKRDRVRMCLGAVIGAAGSLMIFLPRMPAAVSVMAAMMLSAVMTLCAFGWCGWRIFVRSLLVMYALSAGYSGLMLLLWNLCGNGNISVNNGAVYINIDPKLLIITTIVLYALMSFFSGRIRSYGMDRKRCTVTLSENNNRIAVEGLIDTGNTLTEPFSGIPVIVAPPGVIRRIMPQEIADIQEKGADSAGQSRRVRVVPYHTASGTGIMLAYRPQRIDIEIDDTKISDVSAYVAIAAEDRGMRNTVIINPDVVG